MIGILSQGNTLVAYQSEQVTGMPTMVRWILQIYQWLNGSRMLKEMRERSVEFVKYGVSGADVFSQQIGKLDKSNYHNIKSVYTSTYHRLKQQLPEVRQRYIEEKKRQREIENKQKEEERRKNIARKKLDLLSDNSNIIREKCDWIIQNCSGSYQNSVIDSVVGTGTVPVSFARGAAVHNTFATISNAQGAYTRGLIGGLITQGFVYRPMTSVLESEKRLMIAMIVFYTLGYIKDEAFRELWFSFVWAGGVKGKVGINNDNKYTGAAIKCLSYMLSDLALNDYNHVMDTAKALALSYYQDSPKHIQERVAPLLE